ncbi:hypothetical protein M422DRAFT_31310 [Sphaerobolus stellatus SS14]|uniref:Uncharacterized protein n=1 Tax=Sphaerobolus stellatus (strain SS14) TaxID=990650 RepID=A0A0C9VVL4_SPHS4|nr:hypothetical protein M422DRAFT_35624 [Sphaerobolus stellatus SS14]KIJ42336.1 hypothetical protein M422DRAFT_31310 [Sphaerobolus stellatus SS14]
MVLSTLTDDLLPPTTQVRVNGESELLSAVDPLALRRRWPGDSACSGYAFTHAF